MIKFLKPSIFIASLLLLAGCGSSTAPILSTPIENIDNTPIRETELSTAEMQSWGHKDLVTDTIPGMSVEKAYAEIIKNRKGNTVIVAVVDSGIDIDHEDLDGVIWTNSDEIANNGKDDDNNGYVDDIHGWNFLGDAYDETLEMTRIVQKGQSHPQYAKAKAELEEKIEEAMMRKTQYEQILQRLNDVHTALTAYFKKSDYTKKEVMEATTNVASVQGEIAIAKQVLRSAEDDSTMIDTLNELKDAIESITDQLNYNYNVQFNGRSVTGDNPDDITDTDYGNNNVKHSEKGEAHGTHVAGIIAAERNNGKGANGVANNVKIMAVRAVPNGDEYDKDIALSIRYAVDNGAKIINGSFGKYYSQNSEWVRDAIMYAAKNDVLIVSSSGNEGIDIDTTLKYPNDRDTNGKEISDTFISVGAITYDYGSGLVASYSNYGKNNVDVYAPGSKIYSTFPENEYKAISGTSMASPGVSGVAALIWSYNPKLTAAQVKKILMQSGLAINRNVLVGDGMSKKFSEISSSGKIVNAYNALILADKVSRGTVKL